MAKVHILSLDATATSPMNWGSVRLEAREKIAAGKKLLWHLDLGLFNRLPHPLSHPSQFLSLSLAIDHFRDSLWDEFRSSSIGMALYRGSADFLSQLCWSEEQKNNFSRWCQEGGTTSEQEESLLLHLFARDVATDYLRQLAERCPDQIPSYVIFNAYPEDLLVTALNTSPASYGRLKCYFERCSALHQEVSECRVGLCMPPVDCALPALLIPFRQVCNQFANRPIRLVPEETLNSNWDQLDILIFYSKALSPEGWRKMKGFAAAGGTLIDLAIPYSLNHIM